MVSSECHETLITAATRSCANCHLYRLVCSKYLGALTVCWKICLYLTNKLLIAYYTSHNINHMVYTC